MKKLLPAYIISFTFSFMLFIFEPVSLYANNKSDFWFDIYVLLHHSLKAFILMFIFLALIFTILYWIFVKLLKTKNVYNILLIILFIVFICTYIQGNYLSYNLPKLDGSSIQWDNYLIDYLISIILWVFVLIVTIYFSFRIKIDNTKENQKHIINVNIRNKSESFTKSITIVSLVVFAMLSSAFFVTITKEGVLKKKYPTATSTMINYNNGSNKQNFFIFVLDAINSSTFDNVMESYKDFNTTFQDFTYYKDTLSGYGFTRDSVPLILSGKWNRNEKEFDDYSTEAYESSNFLDRLDKEGYQINIYDNSIKWSGKKNTMVDNFVSTKMEIASSKPLLEELLKYIAYKYLPFNLKSKSSIETMDYNKLRPLTSATLFNWNDPTNYQEVKNSDINLISDKVFSFYHLEGAHVDFNLDKDLNQIENGTYEQKIEASYTVIKAYLERLKKFHIYDNSVIIVMSDHGFHSVKSNKGIERGNALLMIKGINEHHKMSRSDLPISFDDLMDAYDDLLDGKESKDLFKNIKKERTRKYIWYLFSKENHMIEYETKGKAWDVFDAYPTGKEYNR